MSEITNPIQQDVDQAVSAGNLAPTVDVGSGNPPMQSAQNPPQPGQQQAPATPTPTAQPTAQPTNAPTAQPNQPQTPAPKPSLRSHIFDTILAAGAGRPVQGPDGRPIPMTRGFMGKAILANALAGMMAGYGSEKTVMGPRGPIRVNNPAEGFAAGAQAGQQQQQQRQQAVDDAQGRAYNTLKRNLDLHATMMNAQKMDYDQQKSLLNDTQPLLDGLESFDAANTEPNVPKMVLDRGLTADELMSKYHVAKNNAVLDGWRAHIDPATGQQTTINGVPQYEPTFTAINDQAILHWNEALRDSLSPNNPVVSKIPMNAPIQAKAILGMVQNNMNFKIAQSALDTWAGQSDEVNGTSGTEAKIDDLFKKSPTIRRAVPFINKYIGEDPDVMLAGLRKEKDPSAQAAAGVLANALGINEDKWKDYRLDQQKKILAADKSMTLESAVSDSIDTSDPVRQQKAKNWLATYRTYQTNLAADKAGADAKEKATAGTSDFAPFKTPDALGFQPKPETFGGNEKDAIKQYNKVHDAFKKQADDLVKMEGTYNQFNDILKDVNSGKDLTGAQSVVALFNAIGISAEPLAGKGFRITGQTIEEHRDALSMPDNLVKKAEATFKNGEVVTPQQIRDYANIALQTRQNKYVGLANQAHNSGVSADSVLPTGNGEKIDPATVGIFLKLAGGNKDKARAAATAKGWSF
jgi:hypothetical protein